MKLDDKSPELDPEWDEFLCRAPGGRFHQSSLWALVKKEAGYRATRMIARKDGIIVGGAQIIYRVIPFFGSIGYVSRGPIVLKPEKNGEAFCWLLLEYLEQSGIQFAIVQPPINADWVSEFLFSHGSDHSMVRVAPAATAMIDLRQDKETILSRVNERTRRYIRSARRTGLRIREGSESDLEIYYRLLRSTAEQRESWKLFGESYYRKMWEVLSPSENVRMTLAERSGQVHELLLVYAFGEAVYGKTILRSEMQERVRGISDLLVWESIEWAKAQGYKFYDFGGISASTATQLQKGISREEINLRGKEFFRLKYGADSYAYPPPVLYVRKRVIAATLRMLLPLMRRSMVMRTALARVRG